MNLAKRSRAELHSSRKTFQIKRRCIKKKKLVDQVVFMTNGEEPARLHQTPNYTKKRCTKIERAGVGESLR